jgi:hypothetical protein
MTTLTSGRAWDIERVSNAAMTFITG